MGIRASGTLRDGNRHRGCWELSGSVVVSEVHWGTGRECTYLGPSGVGAASGGITGFLGGVGGIGDIRGCRGYIGGGRWTGSLTTLGPSPGSQHSHWFPLGSDLHGQGQASDYI